MKLNLDFYKEQEETLTAQEEEIIKIINENNKEDYYKIMQENVNLDVILALSKNRQNILDWYPFGKEAAILEICPNFGEITEVLCKNASRVVSIENSLKKASAIKKRYEDVQNLEVIVGSLENIDINEKFDYITLVGTLENINSVSNCKLDDFINLLKKYLKENGTILIAVDNKLGMKYFSKTDNTGISVTNSPYKKLYTLEDILRVIEKFDLKYKKVYYPMPDYKLTNAIFSDDKLLSKDNLSRNIVYNSEDTIKFYEENPIYRDIIQEESNTFKMFANSYLVEISNCDIKTKNIRFVSFSNMRKPGYKIKTIMEDEYVYKYSGNSCSKKHLDNIKKNIEIIKKSNLKTVDSYDEEKIISKYVNAHTLDKVIVDLVKASKKDEAINLMKLFGEELLQKLEKSEDKSCENVFDKYNVEYEKKDIKNMTFIKNGLWDLVFQNCFYINGEFYFYDQEWIEENLPFEFIIYRAIKYFTRIKKYISDEELFEVLDISKDKIRLFDKLDDKIQEKIRNEIMWNLHTKGTYVLNLRVNEEKLNNKIIMLENKIENKDNEIKILKEQIENLKNELTGIYDSRAWKITEPLRKIGENMRKK